MDKRSKDGRFIVFGEPKIGADERREVLKVLDSGWLSTGPRVAKLEGLLKNYIGSRFACALNSCSAALHLSLLAAGIGEGDEVITVPFTYAATVNAILNVRARPVFVDIRLDTFNIDADLIENRITKRTKAIMPVHFAGRPCDMDKIMAIARRHGLLVIEDAAHAVGAKYRGKMIGDVGDITCFSFYANKNLTTGEGGMVTTNDPSIAEKIRILSFNGITNTPWSRYLEKDLNSHNIVSTGYKYNMTDLHGALGIHQLKRAVSFLKRRNNIWAVYDKSFKDMLVGVPLPQERGTIHARHLYTLLLNIEELGMDRDRFRLLMRDKNIGTGVHFIPLHLNAFYQRILKYKRGDYPNSEFISERIVSLPLSCALSDKDVLRVANSTRDVLSKRGRIG